MSFPRSRFLMGVCVAAAVIAVSVLILTNLPQQDEVDPEQYYAAAKAAWKAAITSIDSGRWDEGVTSISAVRGQIKYIGDKSFEGKAYSQHVDDWEADFRTHVRGNSSAILADVENGRTTKSQLSSILDFCNDEQLTSAVTEADRKITSHRIAKGIRVKFTVGDKENAYDWPDWWEKEFLSLLRARGGDTVYFASESELVGIPDNAFQAVLTVKSSWSMADFTNEKVDNFTKVADELNLGKQMLKDLSIPIRVITIMSIDQKLGEANWPQDKVLELNLSQPPGSADRRKLTELAEKAKTELISAAKKELRELPDLEFRRN